MRSFFYALTVIKFSTWAQFRQRSTYNFYVRRSQKLKKILMTWLYFYPLLGSTSVKAVGKMLVKFTPGLNFTNVLHTAFTLADPESVKRYLWLNCIFNTLGSMRVKLVRKTLMKLTPDDVTTSNNRSMTQIA